MLISLLLIVQFIKFAHDIPNSIQNDLKQWLIRTMTTSRQPVSGCRTMLASILPGVSWLD